ncbi:Mitogen-activated protein kinase HOG1 [Penicillium diatomitis]|uniref:Mitogen-activated protein kinase HOG1 n=1 Tax=Penicillium diatomitis TaxID=2819901 RepID=A0A9W9WV05_9EURO|nr:Mitogen-activated protein kinase HOG1 [Penicillium diatomitis]KAJ5477243.1 Mitogen-activated protein kinase HOG1 [Penicillium diatomitis]
MAEFEIRTHHVGAFPIARPRVRAEWGNTNWALPDTRNRESSELAHMESFGKSFWGPLLHKRESHRRQAAHLTRALDEYSACTDLLAKEGVAVKKIPRPFQSAIEAKRTIREVKLLRSLSHDNRRTAADGIDDRYLVTELLSTDLAHIIRAKPMENQFVQYFFYQIMRALKYIHSAGVVHRDLKPSNILIDNNCDLKICDFGLARTVDRKMTGYVTTRFYRAPETMLTWQKYNVEIDMWSAGCILAEMIEGSPLFPGRNHTDQFLIIADLLGSIPSEVIKTICSKSLLVWDPVKRIKADAALLHPYLSAYHDPADEPIARDPFDWASLDVDHSLETWKTLVYYEILDHFGGAVAT